MSCQDYSNCIYKSGRSCIERRVSIFSSLTPEEVLKGTITQREYGKCEIIYLQ